MHHPPKFDYKGLTIVLSNPSRFDNKELLSGTGGMFITNHCLKNNGINRFMCDIRTLDECISIKPFLPSTKCILALGVEAINQLGNCTTTVNEQRGSPLISQEGIPIIGSYLPQEAIDKKNYEREFNKFLVGANEKFDEKVSEGGLLDKRRHGITKQKNYKFWLEQDVSKAIALINNPSIIVTDDTTYNIYPDSACIHSALLGNKFKQMFFDIETDINLNITCFAFAFSSKPDMVYVVPIRNYNYSLSYSDTPSIFKSLAIAIKNNTLVAHNGAGFDFLVLGHKYKIPIYSVYDTMLSQNRIYPGIEKSLGHCISLPWMFEPYHKDEADFSYRNPESCIKLWRYCGKDVSSLVKLKAAQDEYSRKHIGIKESIEDVNSFIKPYLIASLLGLRYAEDKVAAVWKENDRLCKMYNKILYILIGDKWLKKIRGTGKSSMPNSNKQCCSYFHDLLKYPIVGKTKDGRPCMDKKALFRLKLKMNNPVIDIIIAYRKLIKESGSLKFTPYKLGQDIPSDE